jgi:hypothetical protein
MMADDSVLPQRVVANRDEEAFAELVRCYLNLVYFAALRQVGDDAYRAEDGAQARFARPDHTATSLLRHQMCTG